MWSRGQRVFKYNAGSVLSDAKQEEDLHAHSPTRHENRSVVANSNRVSNPAAYTAWPYRNYPPPPPQWQNNNRETTWTYQSTQEPLMTDPFIDPHILDPTARHRGARPSWEDVCMPDYISNSSSSRAISSMTGISYEHSKQPSIVAPIDEETYSQLFEGVSPPKPLACISQAPKNTSSALPPVASKLSAAGEERSSSCVKTARRPSILKELSQPVSRSVSGSSAKSSLPAEASWKLQQLANCTLVLLHRSGARRRETVRITKRMRPLARHHVGIMTRSTVHLPSSPCARVEILRHPSSPDDAVLPQVLLVEA